MMICTKLLLGMINSEKGKNLNLLFLESLNKIQYYHQLIFMRYLIKRVFNSNNKDSLNRQRAMFSKTTSKLMISLTYYQEEQVVLRFHKTRKFNSNLFNNKCSNQFSNNKDLLRIFQIFHLHRMLTQIWILNNNLFHFNNRSYNQCNSQCNNQCNNQCNSLYSNQFNSNRCNNKKKSWVLLNS